VSFECLLINWCFTVAFYIYLLVVTNSLPALANPNNESPDSYNPPRRLPKEASGIVKDGVSEVSKGCLFNLSYFYFCCYIYLGRVVKFNYF